MPNPLLLSLAALALTLGACALPHQDDWVAAKRQDTEAAYRAYIKKHPRVPEARRARATLVRLAYRKAGNTAAGLRAFARQHPRSAEAKLALKRAADLDWANAEKRNDVRGYRAFLQANPKAPQAKTARTRLAELAWAKVADASDPLTLRSFVAAYPNSAHINEAKRRLNDASWQAAQKKNTMVGFFDYLDTVKKHGLSGKYVDAALAAAPKAAARATVLSEQQAAALTQRVRKALAPITVGLMRLAYTRPKQPLKRGQTMGLTSSGGTPKGITHATLRFGNTEFRRYATVSLDGKSTIIARAIPQTRVDVHHVEGKLKGTQMMGMMRFKNRSWLAMQLDDHPATKAKSPIGFSHVRIREGKRYANYYFLDGKWYSDAR